MSVLVKEVIEKLRLDIVYGEPELLERKSIPRILRDLVLK